MITLNEITKLYFPNSYYAKEVVLYNNEIVFPFYEYKNWYGLYVGEVRCNKEGIITYIGTKTNNIDSEFITSALDFSEFNTELILDTFSPDKKVCGEITNAQLVFYNPLNYKDYLSKVKSYKINNIPTYYKSVDRLNLFNKIITTYKDYITKWFITNKDGEVYTFIIETNKIKLYITLWAFFDYHLSCEVTTNGIATDLTDNKIKSIGLENFETIINDCITGRCNELYHIISIFSMSDCQDVRNYTYKKISDIIWQVTVGYRKHYYSSDPRRSYTYEVNLATKNISCIDNKYHSKFIALEESRFNKYIKELV